MNLNSTLQEMLTWQETVPAESSLAMASLKLNCRRETYIVHAENPGPSCLKLTMSLVNDSLEFQMAILQMHCFFFFFFFFFFYYFLLLLLLKNVRMLCNAKDSHIFST